MKNILISVDSKEWEQEDEAWNVPKPLTVSLGELGFWTQDVIKVLFELGAPPEDRYKGGNNVLLLCRAD